MGMENTELVIGPVKRLLNKKIPGVCDSEEREKNTVTSFGVRNRV